MSKTKGGRGKQLWQRQRERRHDGPREAGRGRRTDEDNTDMSQTQNNRLTVKV